MNDIQYFCFIFCRIFFVEEISMKLKKLRKCFEPTSKFKIDVPLGGECHHVICVLGSVWRPFYFSVPNLPEAKAIRFNLHSMLLLP